MKFITIFDPKRNIDFIKYFRISWICTGILFVLAIVGLLTLGMPWGIDFLGGIEMQAKFNKPVTANEIRDVLSSIGFAKNQVQQYGASQNNEMLIRIESLAAINEEGLAGIKSLLDQNFPEKAAHAEGQRLLFDRKSGSQLTVWLDEPYDASVIDPFVKKQMLEEQRRKLATLLHEKSGAELRMTSAGLGEQADIFGAITADEPQNGRVRYTVHFAGVAGKVQKELAKKFGVVEIRRVDFVDSHVSRQLRTDGLLAVIYAILAIVIYIALRFDMYFSPGAIFSLVNDCLGALLVFIYFRVEFDTPSIAAMLTIVGYSINNTVVVYDRIRETLPHHPKKPLSLEEIKPYVNKAINDTLSRNINSCITTLLASMSICIFTSGSIQNLAIVLTVGIVVAAFSSTFTAPSAFLLAKKYIRPVREEDQEHLAGRPSREDRAKGVV